MRFNLSLPKEHPYLSVVQKIIEDLFTELPEGSLSSKHLPLFSWSSSKETAGHISFYCLSKSRFAGFSFFFDMISRWLLPGKKIDAALAFSVDLEIPDLGKGLLTLSEVMIPFKTEEAKELIIQSALRIKREVRLGMSSLYFARKILEAKGLSPNEKIAALQEAMTKRMERFPKKYESDLWTEMQHILVVCRDEFKAARTAKHLGMIILANYTFRKRVRQNLVKSPKLRHVFSKVISLSPLLSSEIDRTDTDEQIHRKVLGIVIALNFLRENEFLEKKHVVDVVKGLIPGLRLIERSFYLNRRGLDHVTTFYFEVEKEDGSSFLKDEKEVLEKELPRVLQNRIEQPLPALFMPRNEEEVMRNILALSGQIRAYDDPPQVFITFDGQGETSLFFTVICVRAVHPGKASLTELFEKSETKLQVSLERCKTLGMMRKKYAKEANILRVGIAKQAFEREDRSIDLHKARLSLADELSRILDGMRDYNGGLILKQHERLNEVKALLSDNSSYQPLILENLFYAISPAAMRLVLEPERIQAAYLLLKKACFLGKNLCQVEDKSALFIVKSDMLDPLGNLMAFLKSLSYEKIAQADISLYETPYSIFFISLDNEQAKTEICRTIKEDEKEWEMVDQMGVSLPLISAQ